MKTDTILRWAIYLAGSAYVLLFLFSASLRLVYPYEVEWNEGAVLDHAIRVVDGKPIYSAPSLHFSPFVYTPFYYFITAGVMKIGGIGLWAGRIVSIISTIVTAIIAGSIVKRETSSSMLAFTAATLYIAFYHLTGFFYDIVRMDSLAVFIVALALYVALFLRRGFLFAAVLTALAYFTKQQMIFVLPSIAIGLFYRSKRQAMIYTGSTIILIALGIVLANVKSNGWFSYFTIDVPSIKASGQFSWNAAVEFIPKWLAGSLGYFIAVVLIGLAVQKKLGSRNIPFYIATFCFAIISADLSFANPGGYQNVLMPLAFMIALLFPMSLFWMEKALPFARAIVPIVLLLGFLALVYNPLAQMMLFASSRQRRAGDECIAKLKKIPGEVWIPFHGYIETLVGKQSHIHFMAMNDVLAMHDTTSARLQAEIDSALASHRFSAIILDEQRVYSWDSIAHYTESGKLFSVLNVFLSRIGEAPTRPNLIYTPSEQ